MIIDVTGLSVNDVRDEKETIPKPTVKAFLKITDRIDLLPDSLIALFEPVIYINARSFDLVFNELSYVHSIHVNNLFFINF